MCIVRWYIVGGAVPLTFLTYICTIFFSYLGLKEKMTAIIGVLLILIGTIGCLNKRLYVKCWGVKFLL